MTSAGATPHLVYWVAARPIPGESESGDKYVVADFPDGTLVAVIDGLGHGQSAAASAGLAAQVLTEHAGEPLVEVVKRCHEELRKARGVVMSVAVFNAAAASMTWIGVGNVEGILLRASAGENAKLASLISRGGIVGDRLPSLNPITVPVLPGDLLLLATDGIGSMFLRDVRYIEHPQQLVRHIFMEYAKTTDDALILGARWINGDGTTAVREDSPPQAEPRTNP